MCMGYRTLRQCLLDLEKSGRLVRVDDPVSAHLEAAEIHRRVFRSDGPAIWFTNVRDCQFTMASNLFGSMDRVRFLFRDSLAKVQRLIGLKVEPQRVLRHPLQYLSAPWTALKMLPRSCSGGPVTAHETQVDRLPNLRSWPEDGGPFVTLPIVYSEDVDHPGLNKSNIGMYRVQLLGNQYETNQEIGLHYQLHRGIGVHHSRAIESGKPFHINIFVGGTPAMSVAAVMPLPEGMSELSFAGALAGHRIPMIRNPEHLPIYAEADFCISGTVIPNRQLPEGPFGDHLGYYSLAHDFPVMKVHKVYHRKDAVWPFTVVGRPPQEDTMFGQLIHELTGPVIPTVIPGLHSVHAVDAAGVHPLMLAIGSERYVPYEPRRRPQELLTQANAILGQGQMSLAKYLLIVAHDDNPDLDIQIVPDFFHHLLSRIDWQRDVHFQTRTTIDTLDYSGESLNEGSKVVLAAVGPVVRKLPTELPQKLSLPDAFSDPRVMAPGILVVQGPPVTEGTADNASLRSFCQFFDNKQPINSFPLITIVDDSPFTAGSWNDFFWTVFTRSNPAIDIDGIEAYTQAKHWGCRGALVIDARTKPHHAPLLLEDPHVTRQVDALAARNRPISRYL